MVADRSRRNLSRHRRRIVIQWLENMREHPGLRRPIHRMKATKWFVHFCAYFNDEEGVFEGIKTFNSCFSNIIKWNHYPHLSKDIECDNGSYDIYFSLKTQVLDENTAMVSEEEQEEGN